MFDRSIKPYRQDLCAIALLPRKSVTKTATNCGYRRRIAACKLVFHGHAPGRMAENDRAQRAASPSGRTEKSRLNTTTIYELQRRRHVGNEMPREIVGVNILWHVCDVTRAYMYIHTRTRVCIYDDESQDCSAAKCMASLAHLRPLAGVSALTLGAFIIQSLRRYNDAARCLFDIHICFLHRRNEIYNDATCQDFRGKILDCPLRCKMLHYYVPLRPAIVCICCH